MDKNRELAKLLGLCWHEYDHWDGRWQVCRCGLKYLYIDKPVDWTNPDFTTDSGKIELLGMMEAHPKGKLFFAKLMYRGQNVEAIDDDGYISRHYITDTTGLLAQAAVEWLTAQKEGYDTISNV
jgi:hypothetical protein